MNNFSNIFSASALSLILAGSVFAFSTSEQEVLMYKGDLKNYETIHGETTEDSTLYFGDSLEHFIKWDSVNNRFAFSDNVDFGGNQLINARIENLATAPTCDTAAKGRIYFNTSNSFSYVCNGTKWKQVDEEAENPSPYVKSVTPSTFSVGTATTITISGGNFASGMSVSIPTFHGIISATTIVSPSIITATITPATGDTGLYDLVISDAKTSNTSWPGNGVDMLLVETVLIPDNTGNVLWTRKANVTTGTGSIVPSNNSAGWNKGGSFSGVSANTDFRLSFKPQYMSGYSSGGTAMIGMDASDPDVNYTSIDYAIYLNNGTLYVYENGVSRGSFGSYLNTDTLGIQRKGNTIEYYKNGTKFYTSSTSTSGSLVFDSSLYQYLGAGNIKLIY